MNPVNVRRWCLAAALAALAAGRAWSSPAGAGVGPAPEVSLVCETRGVSPGRTVWLGLHLRHPEGCHTYWKHPGIVGLATRVEWELPPGFRAGEIRWPAPEVVRMAAYDAQGYEGETMLLVPLTAPPEVAAGTVTLAAKVSWMCCGEVCRPALKVPFAVTLPVSDEVEADPATQPLFEKYRALVPRRDPAWQVSAKREAGRITLELKPPGTPAMAISEPRGIRFFTADGQVDSNAAQQVEVLPGGGVRMILVPSDAGPRQAATLPGVVMLPAGWREGGEPLALEIEPAV